MSEERKITIKPFLDDRVKGITFAGKVFYPLYLRVNFLNKGTMIKVLNREEESYFVDVESFNKINEKQGLNEGFGTPGRTLMIKSTLVATAVKLEHELKQDRFDFKSFTRKLKIWERPLFNVLKAHFIDLLHQKALGTITDINEFNALNFDWSIRNEQQTKLLFELIEIDDDLKLAGQTLVAYHLYENLILKRVVDFKYAAFETGSVLHWLTNQDRGEFVISKKEVSSKAAKEKGHFSPSFLTYFTPVKEKYFEYQKYIDNIIKDLR